MYGFVCESVWGYCKCISLFLFIFFLNCFHHILYLPHCYIRILHVHVVVVVLVNIIVVVGFICIISEYALSTHPAFKRAHYSKYP